MQTALRKSTNLSLDATLIDEAKALNVNLSRSAEEGVRRAVKKAKEDEWLAENAAAIESYNRWIEEHSLPLAQYRMF